MEIFVFLMLFLFVVFPAAILVGFFFTSWKHVKYGKLLSAVIVLGVIVVCYPFYRAVWPEDQFYLDEFELHSGIALPKESKVIAKEASFPDGHGDYWVDAIIELPLEEFEIIKAKVNNSKGIKCEIDSTVVEEYGKNISPIGCVKIFKEMGQRFEWAVYSNRKTLHFSYITF